MAGFPSNKGKTKPAAWEALEEYRKKVRENYPGKGLKYRSMTKQLFDDVIYTMKGGTNTTRALTILDIYPACFHDYVRDNPELLPEYTAAKEIAAETICDDMENLAIDSIGTDPNVFKGIDLTITTRKWCANRVLENKMKNRDKDNPDANSTPPVNIIINPVGTAEVIPPKPTN